MKRFLLIFSLSLFGLTSSAQNFHLIINGNTNSQTKIIDSIGYNNKHKDAKSAYNEALSITNKLSQIGYIENKLLNFDKKNDSTYISLVNIGEQIKFVHLYIGAYSNLKSILATNQSQDSLFIPFIEIQDFLNQTLQKAEQKGFALTELKLEKLKKKGHTLFAEIYFNLGITRTIDEIVTNYYNPNNTKEKLPKGHIKQLNKKYNKQIFNKNSVEKIYRDFEKFRFVSQTKYPETLLLNDTTKVYVYLEKRKSNNFDGYIGFNTDDNSKLTLNGYLDLTLENTIKAGEQFSIYWKSDGNNQKTFRSFLELPYIFNSNFGLKALINIFKQDSIFQNTKTALDLGYLISYDSRIYLGYQSTESSNIQNSSSSAVPDFNSAFFTTNFEYNNIDYDLSLFPEKTKFSITTGIGKRTNNNLSEETETTQQYYIDLKASHTFAFNKKNYLNINSQNFYLKSSNYLINELYRFGGINSIRGFSENSFQAQSFISILTEYRYIVSTNLYLHSILDYCIYKDPFLTENKLDTLTGVGFGIGLQTKNGLLKITFANGIEKNQKTDFYNTIISLNYNIRF
ncbi:hypothetical protein [Flavobacterium faecale]|uniref:hypothetical protein n=1 Tax=Flavobacterium faecale TaxID=1355330 RepID=UPI003AADAB23